jgi:hypothetical protein
MRKRSHPLLAVTALALAAALSGCVSITGQSSQQMNTIGAVRLTTSVCFSTQPGCADKGNSNTGSGAGFQVLLGYRLPEDTSAPQAFSTISGQPLSFGRDPSYAAELQRLAPAAAGQKWVGYRSPGLTSTPAPSFTVSPSFALRQGDDGTPFAGPFDYRVVAGGRATPSDPNAPVNCGADLRGDSNTKTSCVDSPPITDVGSDLQQQTQDLGIIDDPVAQRASRGQTEPVQFRVVYSGHGDPPNFDLRASTDIPDANASVHPGSLTPDAGPIRVRVTVRVPPTTPRGSYDVTLIASLPNGQTRSRTQELRIGRSGIDCGSLQPTITGTPGPDHIVGTRKRDVISSLGGDDRINGRAGNDLICAGGGNDRVNGGPGNDAIAGRAGRDMLIGGHGHDLLIGGAGRDRFKH